MSVANMFINNIKDRNYNIDNIESYFVLIKKDNSIVPLDFYMYEVSTDIYETVCNNLILYKVSAQIIKNNLHYNNILIMSKEDLDRFNLFKYELSEHNIVIPILNIKFDSIQLYLSQYKDNYIETIYYLKLIDNHFNNNNPEYFENIIKNLYSSDYWTKKHNINFTEEFKKRNFTLDLSLYSNNHRRLFKNKNPANYLMGKYKSDIYNMKKLLNNNGNYLYNIPSKSKVTIENTIDLLNSLDNKNRFIMLCSIMISNNYFHFINNPIIMQLLYNYYKNYSESRPLIKYLFSYFWINFVFLENINSKNIKTNDNIVFTSEVASKLPIFPVDYKNIKSNPYLPLLIDNNDLGYNSINRAYNNIFGIEQFTNIDLFDVNFNNYRNNGICNTNQFQERLNIFCSGDINKNIFEGFDFKKYNVCICGSVMTACSQVRHILMSCLNTSNNFQTDYTNYFDDYYKDSDIDIMFSKHDIEFKDRIDIFYETIKSNINKFLQNSNDSNDINITAIKYKIVFVNKKFIENEMKNSDITDININNNNIKKLFIPFVKEENIDNFKIKLLQENESVQNSSVLKILESTKYKINSQFIKRPIELFSVDCKDPFGKICEFHLPNVRAYYDGTTCYMLPSFISAHLTYINIDYKYFSSSTDQVTIINKYRLRGFGTILNENEIKLYSEYHMKIRKLRDSKPYGIIKGPINLYNYNVLHSRYDTNKYNYNTRYKYNAMLYKISKDYEIYRPYAGEETFKLFPIIDNNGNLMPLNKWLIDFSVALMKL